MGKAFCAPATPVAMIEDIGPGIGHRIGQFCRRSLNSSVYIRGYDRPKIGQ